MQKPSIKDFDFKKVKLGKGGGLIVTATVARSEKGEVHHEKLKANEYTYEPHDDLKKELEKLKPHLATLYGLLDVETIITAIEFKATAAQKKAAKIHTEGKMFEIEVTGISVSGEGQNRGCVITGKYNGQAINSKRIRFIGEGLGFEDKVQEAADVIIEETYKYLYKDKHGTLEEIPESQVTIDGTGDQFKMEVNGGG